MQTPATPNEAIHAVRFFHFFNQLKMKPTKHLLAPLAISAVMCLTSSLNASYRTLDCTFDGTKHVKISIGEICKPSKPIRGWDDIIISTSIQVPGNPQDTLIATTKQYTSSEPFHLENSDSNICFHLVVSADSAPLFMTDEAMHLSAAIEMIDSSNGSTIATLFSIGSLSEAYMMPTAALHVYTTMPQQIGHTVLLRLRVAWAGDSVLGDYSIHETAEVDTLPYVVTPGPFAKMAASTSLSSPSLMVEAFPMPAPNELNLFVGSSIRPNAIHVFDLNGRELANLRLATSLPSQFSYSIPMGWAAAGLYGYRLDTDAGPVFGKFIVKR